MITLDSVTEPVAEQIRAHAREGHAESFEVCGLLIEVDGALVYRPEKNMSDHPEAFAIDPRAYHEAANAGELLAVVHSHNGSAGEMSEMDWRACNRSSLTWLIVQMPSEEIRAFYPQRQDERFVGRTYREFEFDAFTLVGDYLAREEGIKAPPPPAEVRNASPREALGILDHYASHGFVSFRKEEGVARPSDIVLMQWSSGLWDHVGVLTKEGNLLHHPPRMRSRVAIYGRDFRARTGHYLRHSSLC